MSNPLRIVSFTKTIPTARDLSDDDAVESILADIPFFTVGILAFCTLSFFVAMRRLNLLLAYLHTSILAAFVACILDISQILSRGRIATDFGLGLSSVAGVIVAREIGFAVSTGFKLLFFWVYVAEPPKAEVSLPLTQKGFHSGAWNRWGFVGSVLRWATLVMVVIVFILQTIWRVTKNLTGFNPMYNADAGIEIILSAIFILKLGLNTWICSVVPRGRVLASYSGFGLALIFSVGIGLGNLISLKFTDSVLGRFLQAIEFYTIVLSALLATFYPQKVDETTRVAPFRPIPSNTRESSFHITPPNVSTPHIPPRAALGPYIDLDNERPPLKSRDSSASRISAWLATRGQRISERFRTPQENDKIRLWDYTDAERGQSPTYLEKDTTVDDHPYVSPVSTDYVDVERPTISSSLGDKKYGHSITSTYLSQNSELNWEQRSAPRALGTPQPYSPAFSLNGISGTISPFLDQKPGQRNSPNQPRRRSSGISSMIRQQNELDKSIAALRIFDNNEESQDEKREDNELSRSSTQSKHSNMESISAPSEISLSYFPRPPWEQDAESFDFSRNQQRASISTYSTARPLRNVRSTASITVDKIDFDLMPPTMPAADFERVLSVPYSEADSELLASARTPKFDSQGTQYDVTSFIGDLTTPGHKKEESASTKLTDLTSDDEVPATIVTLDRSNSAHYARPVYVGSPLGGAGQFGVGRGAKGPKIIGLPSKPKLTISSPVKQVQEENSPWEFETPRRAPFLQLQRAGSRT